MAKRGTKKKTTRKRTTKKQVAVEPDSLFFLKLVVLLVVGSQWVRVESLPDWSIPVPVGLILGLILVSHEHFQFDRKFEYVLLLLVSFISFWLPLGLIVAI